MLDILNEHESRPVVFHWYSGPLSVLDEAIASGHYFSINPAMLKSDSGLKILKRIPRQRLLTETDGPYVKVARRMACPWDIAAVEASLSQIWSISAEEVRQTVWHTFRRMLAEAGVVRSEAGGHQQV